MNYFEMKKAHTHALNKAETIITLAENGHREMTAAEQADVDQCLLTTKVLSPQIAALKSKNSLQGVFDKVGGVALLSGNGAGIRSMQAPKQVFGADYLEGFF